MRMWNKASLERTWFIYHIKLWSWLLLSFISIICLFQAAGWFPLRCQEGIMPLFLFRSAIARRLWLDTRLLLASFLRRSNTVSKVWPCPLGLPTTLLGRSGRKLENRKDILTNWEPSLPMVPPWYNSRPAVCFAVATEWTNSWLNLPLPLLHGSSSSFSSLSQQSWVLHKLVPVYIILKQKQWIRHHVWVTEIKSALRNWLITAKWTPNTKYMQLWINVGKVLFSLEWCQYRYWLLVIIFRFIILYLVSFPQHLRYCEWSVEPRR